MPLRTRRALALYRASRPAAAAYLAQVDQQPQAVLGLEAWKNRIEKTRLRNAPGPDALFDDLYVLDRCIDFLAAYARIWRLIAQSQFTASWDALQDALDLLRLIKRFSAIDISFFENQLTELERAYPYNVFFSIGAVVGWFECSLCGRDIDSLDCPHRRGHLYRGKMAQAMAKNVVRLDHVAMVEQPQDKRCVVSYENSAPHFSVVRMIGQLIVSGTMQISRFERLAFSKRKFRNPDYIPLGRNDRCYCGSGAKFKRCCTGKAYEEREHVDIVASPTPSSIEMRLPPIGKFQVPEAQPPGILKSMVPVS